jgi:REP element-mobilizing transposase RayT
VSRPLRDTDPSKVHLITCRTVNAELLLVPSEELNEIIGGIIARYAEMYSIEIFAFVVLSNHYHLLIRGPEGIIPSFEACINREISIRTNRLIRRSGNLWGRRYDDQIAPESADAVEAFVYVITNPVKHGLVSHPRLWPGLSSYWQSINNPEKEYTFLHHTAYNAARIKARRLGELVRRQDFETKHVLKICPLPCFAGLGVKRQREKLRGLIEERTLKLEKERKAAGKGFIGRKAVLVQPKRGSFPQEVSRSPRPCCYTKSIEVLKAFKEEYKSKLSWYLKASISFRAGDFSIDFPPFCFLPPLHIRPKEFQFIPT